MELTIYEIALLRTLVNEQLAKTILLRDTLASIPGMNNAFRIYEKDAAKLVELQQKLQHAAPADM